MDDRYKSLRRQMALSGYKDMLPLKMKYKGGKKINIFMIS